MTDPGISELTWVWRTIDMCYGGSSHGGFLSTDLVDR